MNPEQCQRRMLAALPLLLQDGANIGELFGALARVLSGTPEDAGMEYGVTRVLRSRWHPLADGCREGSRVVLVRDAVEGHRVRAVHGGGVRVDLARLAGARPVDVDLGLDEDVAAGHRGPAVGLDDDGAVHAGGDVQ